MNRVYATVCARARYFTCSLWMKNWTSFAEATFLWTFSSVWIFRGSKVPLRKHVKADMPESKCYWILVRAAAILAAFVLHWQTAILAVFFLCERIAILVVLSSVSRPLANCNKQPHLPKHSIREDLFKVKSNSIFGQFDPLKYVFRW